MMSSALSASKDFSTIFRRSPAARSSERFAVARLRTAGFFSVMRHTPMAEAPTDLRDFQTSFSATLRWARIAVAEIGFSRWCMNVQAGGGVIASLSAACSGRRKAWKRRAAWAAIAL